LSRCFACADEICVDTLEIAILLTGYDGRKAEPRAAIRLRMSHNSFEGETLDQLILYYTLFGN
jgi:hypothetical protein